MLLKRMRDFCALDGRPAGNTTDLQLRLLEVKGSWSLENDLWPLGSWGSRPVSDWVTNDLLLASVFPLGFAL